MCQSDEHTPEVNNTSVPAPYAVLQHVVDVHCHPTDSPFSQDVMDGLAVRICAMATRATDQALVKQLAAAYPEKVIPCFGYHPWFTHWIALSPASSREEHYRALLMDSSPKPNSVDAFEKLLAHLPEPILLADVLSELRGNLASSPDAMLGEVGLDRVCRIPYAPPAATPYASNAEAHDRSPFTIPLAHQLAILEAQLDLAVELRRNVSLHSVKSQEATVTLLDKMKEKHKEKWTGISIDMHSCGVSVETLKDIQRKHPNVFISLSTAINSRSPAHKELIAACPDDRILAESDYHDVSCSSRQTWDILRRIAEVKGWPIESHWLNDVPPQDWGVVRRLEHNWTSFMKAGHAYQRQKEKSVGRKSEGESS